MSKVELDKWNQKYAAGEYTPNDNPSALLVTWLPRLPQGRALDLACGLGRNALFLVQSGFTVDAIDISSAGLVIARRKAIERGLTINWLQADLDNFFLSPNTYEVIVNNFYLNRGLAPSIAKALKANGILLFEHHLISAETTGGPASPELRLKPGELPQLFHGLKILHYSEAVVPRDGRDIALAQLVARKRVCE